MNSTEKRIKNQYFIYDSTLPETIGTTDFDIAHYRASGRVLGQVQGRGTTYFVQLQGRECVLRHYRRGGMVARWLNDRYWWAGLYKTRAWQEWFLLGQLRQRELPVPPVVAARVYKRGLFYRADIIIQRIPCSHSLAHMLTQQALSDVLWKKIGVTLRRFHQRGVYHADLNAHNILLDDAGSVYLIDFDKGEIRRTRRAWQMANLQRFRRSLEKLTQMNDGFKFNETAWQWMMSGYTQL
ncbi:MAG: 3-deoxy-D-manno-octulosonic acid kinase [Gammaproteobacteria bacterium]|nr:3-deoxy-D-manno-octulosonic acid kinase [Gammaproteobacteria bacterium]